MDKCSWRCTTTSLHNSIQLRTENICPSAYSRKGWGKHKGGWSIGCHGRSKVAQRMFRLRHGRHGRREVLSMFKTVAQRSPRRKAHASPWSQNGCARVGDWSPSKEMHTVVNIVYQYLCFCLPCITIVPHLAGQERPLSDRCGYGMEFVQNRKTVFSTVKPFFPP